MLAGNKGGVVMTQKKKIIIIAVVAVVALFVATVGPFVLSWPYGDQKAREGAKSPDFDLSSFSLTYGFDGDYMSVEKTSFLTGNRVKVADLYFGLPVTHIAKATFKDRTNLENVTLPGGLMGISAEAFSGCTSLDDIVIPAGTNSIGTSAFAGCTSLTDIALPGNISVGGYAFDGCTALYSVTINAGMTVISDNAFVGCSSLTIVSIPNDIISIGADAFAGCGNLVYSKYDNALYLGNAENPYVALIKAADKNITSCDVHPDTKIMAADAFVGCSALETVNFDGTIEDWNGWTLPYGWDAGTGNYTVFCSDGQIAKDGTITNN